MQFSFFILAAFTFQSIFPAKLTNRQIVQEGGSWLINYTFNKNIYYKPEINIKGWVSNSRVPNHSTARHLILSQEKSSYIIFESENSENAGWYDDQKCTAKLSSVIENNHLKIKIEHQHGIYGGLNPLVGPIKIEIKLDKDVIRDSFNLIEKSLFYPSTELGPLVTDRLDKRYSVNKSPKGGSIHLEANIPGYQYYRFPEIVVRYSSRIKLSFFYLIAAGTEDECFVWLTQYQDTPSHWRKMDDGQLRRKLIPTPGGWKKVEYFFKTEKEATTMVLEFKIVGDAEVGEMWIDCVGLEYLDKMKENGP